MPTHESNSIRQKWQEVLQELVKEVEVVAQSSQRTRKLSVEQLVQTLVLGCLDKEPTTLGLWRKIASELGVDITCSSLDERLTSRLVLLLYMLLQSSISHQVAVKSLPVPQLSLLSRLVLYDSTQIRVPAELHNLLRQSPCTEKGQLKLQVGCDYLKGQLQALSLQTGTDPDQKDEGLLEQAVEDALLVFDLGYFSQDLLRDVDQRGAYFVTRLQTQTALYDPISGHKLDIVEQLKDQEQQQVEMDVLLGAKARLPVRLLARRVSPKQAAERRRKIRKKAKQNGYTPSQGSLLLCDWEILVTNLSTTWTFQQVFDLYRIRWQIELIFKGWKSYLKLDQLGNWRTERILCQLLAGLLGAVLCHTSFAIVRYVITETSWFKALTVIQRQVVHLTRILRRDNCWGISTWAVQLRQALLTFAQQQNLETAPSSLDRLINWGQT